MRSIWSGFAEKSSDSNSCQSSESSRAAAFGLSSIPCMPRKMCWIGPEPMQEGQAGSAANRRRTALLTFGMVQADLGSFVITPTTPVGGLEVNVKHVSQPATQATKSNATRKGTFQQLRKIV